MAAGDTNVQYWIDKFRSDPNAALTGPHARDAYNAAKEQMASGGLGLTGPGILDKATKGQQGGNNPISKAWDAVSGGMSGGGMENGYWVPSGQQGMGSESYGGIISPDWIPTSFPSIGSMSDIFGSNGILGPKSMGPGGGMVSLPNITGSSPDNPLGGIFGKDGIFGRKEKVHYGENMVTPDIPGYKDISGLKKLSAETITQSPWRSMALDKQAAEEAGLRDQAAQQSMSGMAQARNALAMRGGLRGGAAERISRGGLSDLMSARQNIGQQGVINRANIGMQGAQMDTDVNKFNALQKAGVNQFNLQQAINDISNLNEQNRFKYGEQMKLKGAGMSAQAIENAGKK